MAFLVVHLLLTASLIPLVLLAIAREIPTWYVPPSRRRGS